MILRILCNLGSQTSERVVISLCGTGTLRLFNGIIKKHKAVWESRRNCYPRYESDFRVETKCRCIAAHHLAWQSVLLSCSQLSVLSFGHDLETHRTWIRSKVCGIMSKVCQDQIGNHELLATQKYSISSKECPPS